MNLFQAIILGIIQGLSEFLPISSTAHLRIIPALLGWGDPGAAFTAVIQFGTLVAVLIYFYNDIVHITSAVIKGIATRNFLHNRDAQLGWMIAAGTIPIVVFGLTFKHSIETSLRSLYIISASMILLAIVLTIAEMVTKKRAARKEKLKSLDNLSWKESIVIGLWQSLALIPGSSRSGTTITGGLFLGLDRETAARFSFLLSLPSVFAAGILELVKQRHELLSINIGATNLIVSTIVSGIVGYASIAFLLDYLKKHTTYLFIVYRIIVGICLLYLLSTGVLQPL
ncbi:MAG: undecaprenyl-diphosphate phosphatase [Bacteroidota bacterium]|nr:undecaprenyl-diphosphate phosphatase [Bacteroidota bacterium]